MLDQRETKENLRTRFPIDRKPYTGGYDHEADSDLEEDEDWDSANVKDSQVTSEKRRSDASDSGTLIDGKISDAMDSEHSDIVSISDVDSVFLDSVETKAEAEVPATPSPTHIGTVVVIEDVAFVT